MLRYSLLRYRLKGNAAGFSAFGSLEMLGNRTKVNRKEDRQEIKKLKRKLAISRKNIEDLKILYLLFLCSLSDARNTFS
jgi:hypothetical protein